MSQNSTESLALQSTARLTPRRCLLLHVEPTTYISHKIEHLKLDGDFDFEVHFVTANRSQNWGVDSGQGEILDDRSVGVWTRSRRVFTLARKILGRRYSVALVAGWGTPLLLLFSLLLKVSGTPYCYDSDTQLATTRTGVKETIKSVLYPTLFRSATALLPAGTRQAEFFAQYGVAAERIHVQQMTVDITKIKNMMVVDKSEFRRAHAIPNDAVVFIFVGRLEPIKALEVLYAAFERLVARVPECVLVIVGDGKLRDEAAGIAERLPSVRYVGRQEFEGVVHWMRASDVFVLPSYLDQWGLVINEAMACGLPVIATDRVGAVDDLVVEGRNGYIVRAGDVGSLYEAMLTLARTPELRKSMGEASEEIIAPWTLEAEIRNVKQVLAKVSR